MYMAGQATRSYLERKVADTRGQLDRAKSAVNKCQQGIQWAEEGVRQAKRIMDNNRNNEKLEHQHEIALRELDEAKRLLDEAQREEEKCQQEYNDAEHALTIHQE
jgi:chromosome segregation ATPase